LGENNVKVIFFSFSFFFCKSKEQLKTSKEKNCSRGTNSRLPFAVNVILNLSINNPLIFVASPLTVVQGEAERSG